MTLRDFVERYAVALGVVGALILAIVILPGNVKGSNIAASGSGTTSNGGAGGASSNFAGGAGGSSTAGGGGSAGPSGGTVSAGGGAGGSAGGSSTAGGNGSAAGGAVASGPQVVWGQGPQCRGDGRQMGVSYAMPPCVLWKGGDNGGPTFRGVTANKILVVRYLAQQTPGTNAILTGAQLADPPATVAQAYAALTRYGNLHYQTYGRQLVMVDYNASGPPSSDESSRADAIDIANNVKPFAVIEGDPSAAAPTAFIHEIAARGVICMCSTSLPSDFYTSVPALVFSPLPTADEYVSGAAEYVCKHLAGRNADHAGVGTQGQPRQFGLLYINGSNGVVDPYLSEYKPLAEKAFAQCGIRFAKEVSYNYEPGQNQSDVTNLIAQMKAAHVTTVVPFWDPLYPILITQEATHQAYFPEWMITGTGLSDTTTAGRLYDQQQWTHAFGESPLWITWATVARSAGYREYHWARPQDAPGSEGVLINIYRSRIAELFTMIQLAGPTLTNDTFTQAAFSYPHTGGTPGRPLLYRTRQYPTWIKDFSEVWYDAKAQGPDERGKQSSGMITRADGGRRYQLGYWYVGPMHAYQASGGVTVTDNPPGGGDWPTDSANNYPASQNCLSCTS